MLNAVLDMGHMDKPASFHQIAASGVLGIIHKVSEGTYFVDDAYAARRVRGESVGLWWAGYHFASAEDAVAQAEFYLKHANDPPFDALDMETNTTHGTMTRLGAEHYVSHLYGRRGLWPRLYINESALFALGLSNDSPLLNCDLWIAKYSLVLPTLPSVWRGDWKLWQAHGTEPGENPGYCDGVIGSVDRSLWDGTADELKSWWRQ